MIQKIRADRTFWYTLMASAFKASMMIVHNWWDKMKDSQTVYWHYKLLGWFSFFFTLLYGDAFVDLLSLQKHTKISHKTQITNQKTKLISNQTNVPAEKNFWRCERIHTRVQNLICNMDSTVRV